MIYLFYGPDDFSRSQALAALKASIPAEIADLNISTLDGRRLKLDELQAACEAFPFLAERRLVIVHDALKGLRSSELRDGLKAYLGQLPPSTDLVFVETDEPDQRTALAKELLRCAEVRVFRPLEGEALQAWLQARAAELGVSLLPAAARLLVDHAGSDGWTLWNELQKLAAYVGPGASIGPAEIRLLVADEAESSLFAVIDAVFGRQQAGPAPHVLVQLHTLLAGGEAPHYILFMLGRQLRLLLAAHSAGRVSPEVLARSLGQRPFVVRKAQDQARRFSAAELRQLHDRLVELDQALKTGQIEAEAALDLFVGQIVLAAPAGTRRP